MKFWFCSFFFSTVLPMEIILTCFELCMSYDWVLWPWNCLQDAANSCSNTCLASRTIIVWAWNIVRPHLDYWTHALRLWLMAHTSFTIEAMIRGYHIYSNIWSAVIDGELPCEEWSGNLADPFCWKTKNCLKGRLFTLTLLLSLLASNGYFTIASNFFFPSSFVKH